MTIAQLIQNRLEETHSSKRAASLAIGITLPTFDSWRAGLYVPEPWDHDRMERLADWLGISYTEVVKIILIEKGLDEGTLRRAMGVYISSLLAA